ncbi:hypothetical protein [Weizmannia acidilactici]|uniref:hypothetical protein n=1 Tax=Weizmannia acidilactici TaxID=2607726 RepID=UPI00124F061F|nr:hypothetical protein [Weizmannia acidilactici]
MQNAPNFKSGISNGWKNFHKKGERSYDSSNHALVYKTLALYLDRERLHLAKSICRGWRNVFAHFHLHRRFPLAEKEKLMALAISFF